MHLASRLHAGRLLATKLYPKYRFENTAIVALNDGGVMVGAQIAKELHCVLTLLPSEEINLPHEPEAIAAVTPGGRTTYNSAYASGELEELRGEFYGLIEQEKLERMHSLNQLVGSQGVIHKDLLKGHNVILVSDGFKTGFQVDMAVEYLKPIAIDKLVVAAPFASVQAVDRMHIIADDLYCLNVISDYTDTNRYYDKQDVPSHEVTIKTIQTIVLNWK